MFFPARWGRDLTTTTAVILAAVSTVVGFVAYAAGLDFVRKLGPVIVIALVTVACVAWIRGYEIAQGELRIRQWFRAEKIDLRDISRVEYVPGALSESVRTFAVGGLFAFLGNYRSERWGDFEAFVTDGERTVVVEGRRPVVISPGDPERFVRALRDAIEASVRV